MLSELNVICALEAEGLLKEPTRRKHWIHPFKAERETSKRFEKFHENIRKCDERFFEYYRMSKASFDELLEVLRPRISKRNTKFRRSISPEERLTITLRASTTCNRWIEMTDNFRRNGSKKVLRLSQILRA
ncbi:uncharacterized protein [Macrobrachium rosenbergii]|uniref:uncharacterized protein isoform X2 n=1 Tax=Macrobrachium rosenbergii TaxID=79674 RepID=UPI0034D3A854